MEASCSEEEFIRLFSSLGPTETAKHLGISERAVYKRRASLQRLQDVQIFAPRDCNDWRHESRKRLELRIENGVILVGSDAHFWPGYIPTAHRGMCKLAKQLNASVTVLDGDVNDGAKTSRHPDSGWQHGKPSVKEELEVCQERLNEIEKAAPKAQRFWIWGNHDYRFEAKLIAGSAEYQGVSGFALPDHFPKWRFGISLWINDDLVIKHRWKGGIHATHNNTMGAGKSMLTGHLHSLKVTPFDDYNGTRWGIDSGTLNDPYGPHAEYTEDNPLNHRSGFIVLTFFQGRLLWPEIAHVISENHIEFRGQVIRV